MNRRELLRGIAGGLATAALPAVAPTLAITQPIDKVVFGYGSDIFVADDAVDSIWYAMEFCRKQFVDQQRMWWDDIMEGKVVAHPTANFANGSTITGKGAAIQSLEFPPPKKQP